MIKISVLIPVHRVDSSYLDQCLGSLRTQTLIDFEALLILNDSSENEKNICSKFCHEDSRFKQFNTNIADVSTARNIGLADAQGKYITFLDSDDLLSKSALETLYELVEKANADVGLANTKKFWNNRKEEILFNFKESSDNVSLKKIPNFAICGYIFKRDVINKFHLRFKEQLKLSEDRVFLYEYFSHCNKTAYSNEITYLYRQHDASVCHVKKTPMHAIQQIHAANYIAESLKNNPLFTKKEITHIKRSLSRMGMVAYICSGSTSCGRDEIKHSFHEFISPSAISFYYCWYRATFAALIGKLLHL